MKNYISLVLLAAALLQCRTIDAQITAKGAILHMRKGINMGNTFDAPNGETSWGNPSIQEYYFDDFKAAGIDAVRLPVTWNKHTQEIFPYKIDSAFLSRVEQVIDWGLARGLFIIINAHHEGWLKNNNDCINNKTECGFSSANQQRFDSIWNQIARRFKNKSDHLLFEILNEPEKMTLENLNSLNKRILGIIRNSGGKNASRNVVFAGTNWSSYADLKAITVPSADHKYLIANFHCYDPWSFVSGNDTVKWGTQSDKDKVKKIFDTVKTWADKNDIPVMVNEWGAGPKHDYQSRVAFYRCYVDNGISHGFGLFAWDDGGGFLTYNRRNRTWVDNTIKNIITRNEK